MRISRNTDEVPPAAPQAPQKHFTDEELKQQYGIHLATRLQADADGKEAKWADIDDDEDDWAPDTIEWNDGTKITLSHNDPAAALAEEQAAAAAEKRKQEEHSRARMPPPKPTTSVGPNAKVLKLGTSGQPKQLGGGGALKSSSEKPTLVAKPTPPAAVKSPWASLPPVDKVTPVAINPPIQSSTPRFQQSDIPATESISAPTSQAPAMEIAADSFTRTPRENQGGAQGQLYNSQSGQYEPVTSSRRGSVRKDQNFRPPAVLQRPSQHDQRPAEPSAAFQSQRSGSQQEGSRWDRRASSTVSGGSGLHGRRGSIISRGAGDGTQSQADTVPLQSPLTPGLPQAHLHQDSNSQSHMQQPMHSPAVAKVQQSSEMGSAAPSPKQGRVQLPDGIATSHMPVDMNAETERQKKLMKEKRELAIKRKKEEEEKEEAAKKERIKLKMEQLGLAPLGKEGSEKKPNEVKQVVKREVNQEAQKPVQPQEDAAQAPQSPPKPPMPDNCGGTKQYGVMKMHGPSLTNGITPTDRPKEDVPNSLQSTQRISLSKTESPARGEDRISSPLTNGDIKRSIKEPSAPGSPEARDQPLFQPQRQRPWNNVPRDPSAFTGWSGNGMTTHSAPTGNLWGPPPSYKALGNGVFDGNVPRPSSRHAPYPDHHSQPTPQPIGPPRSSQRPRESPESGRVQHANSSPLTENFQSMPSYPSQEGHPTPFNRAEPSAVAQRPLAPSETAVSIQPKPNISPERLQLDPGQQRSKLAAWGSFQSTSAKDDAEKRRQAAQENAARLAEEARTGIRYEPQLPVLNETWRQVKVDDEAGQRRLIGVAKGSIVPDATSRQQVNGDIRLPQFANPPQLGHHAGAGAGRGSRFFPTSGQGYYNQQRAATYTMGYNRSPSPPPPDSVHHPVYARSQARPLVNLPITKPKPTVRLPPALTTAPPTPVMADIQAVPLRAVSQPLVQNPSWQDRFNGLLGVKKPSISPEKSFAEMAGFSETKLPFELPPVQVSAAVSLPLKDADATKPEGSAAVASIFVEDEEALFEEREFGSLPIVLLPTINPKVKLQKNRKGLPKVKEPRPVQDVVSKGVLEFSLEDKEHDDPNGFAVFINFKGVPFPKKKIMPRTNVTVTVQNQRGNRNFSNTNKGGRGPKSREASGNFGTQKPVQNGPQRTPIQSGANTHGKGVRTKNWARVPAAG